MAAPTEYKMAKNYVYSTQSRCDRIYKSETCCPLKVRLEERGKAVWQEKVEKANMVEHIWKKREALYPCYLMTFQPSWLLNAKFILLEWQ